MFVSIESRANFCEKASDHTGFPTDLMSGGGDNLTDRIAEPWSAGDLLNLPTEQNKAKI